MDVLHRPRRSADVEKGKFRHPYSYWLLVAGVLGCGSLLILIVARLRSTRVNFFAPVPYEGVLLLDESEFIRRTVLPALRSFEGDSEIERDLNLRQAIRKLDSGAIWRLRNNLHEAHKYLAAVEDSLKLGTWDYPAIYGSSGNSSDPGALKWLEGFDDALMPVLEIAIPFYLYEDPEFLKFEAECQSTLEGQLGAGGHLGEYYFHQHLKTHRWRVTNPAEALLYVVPIYIGLALEGQCGDLSRQMSLRQAYGTKLIANATAKLEQSPWFRINGGNDHVFMSTHWRTFWWLRDAIADPNVKVWNRLIWGRLLASFEESFCPVMAPFSSLYLYESARYVARTRAQESVDIAEYIEQRPYNLFFVGRVWNEMHKGGYDTRRSVFKKLPGHLEPNVLVTTSGPTTEEVPQCPTWNPETDTRGSGGWSGCLLDHSPDFFIEKAFQAKFHLTMRGDDWGSSRLYDIIHAGAIPVMLSDGGLDKFLANGCHVDWDQILIRIPEFEWRNSTDIPPLLKKYIPDWTTEAGRLEMSGRLKALRDAQRHLLWSHPESQVAEDFLLDAARRCLPEAVILRKRYSAPVDWSIKDEDLRIKQASTPPRSRKPLGSLSELTCPFVDSGKGVFRPAVFGVGRFQRGWNQDD